MIKRLVFTFLLTLIKTVTIAQTIESNELYMNWETNQTWLTKTKSLNIEEQIIIIQNRFFKSERLNFKTPTNKYSPLIIINGVALNILDSLSKESQNKITGLLNIQNINDIHILDKQPDEWLFHKPFSGAVIISIADTKVADKIFGVKLK